MFFSVVCRLLVLETTNMKNNIKLLENIGQCPDCKGELKVSEEVECLSCGNKFPIKGELPVLVKQSKLKEVLDSWDSDIEDYSLYTTPSIVKLCEEKTGFTLDACCGVGLYTKHFNSNVVSFDIVPKYVKRALKQNENQNNVFLIADMKNIPFKRNSFGLVFCSSALEHFTKEEGDEIIPNLINLSNDSVIIDVPNNGNWIISFLKNISSGIYEHREESKHEILNHSRLFSVKDLKEYGFEVSGCLGGLTYLKTSKFTSTITNFFMSLCPSLAGTIIGVKEK